MGTTRSVSKQAKTIVIRANSLEKCFGWGAISRSIRTHARVIIAVSSVASEGVQGQLTRIDVLVLWQGRASSSDVSKLEPNS